MPASVTAIDWLIDWLIDIETDAHVCFIHLACCCCLMSLAMGANSNVSPIYNTKKKRFIYRLVYNGVRNRRTVGGHLPGKRFTCNSFTYYFMTYFDRLCLPYCLEWVNGSQLTHSLWHYTCYKQTRRNSLVVMITLQTLWRKHTRSNCIMMPTHSCNTVLNLRISRK